MTWLSLFLLFSTPTLEYLVLYYNLCFFFLNCRRMCGTLVILPLALYKDGRPISCIKAGGLCNNDAGALDELCLLPNPLQKKTEHVHMQQSNLIIAQIPLCSAPVLIKQTCTLSPKIGKWLILLGLQRVSTQDGFTGHQCMPLTTQGKTGTWYVKYCFHLITI